MKETLESLTQEIEDRQRKHKQSATRSNNTITSGATQPCAGLHSLPSTSYCLTILLIIVIIFEIFLIYLNSHTQSISTIFQGHQRPS